MRSFFLKDLKGIQILNRGDMNKAKMEADQVSG